MKTIISTLLLLLIIGTRTHAQGPFILQISPHEQTIGNGSASFTISVSAQLGFTASVYLTAASPTLSQSNISLGTSVIASPYTATATLTVRPTNDKTPSVHIIVIEAKNGPAVARDTVTVRMTGNRGWRVYTKDNSPLPDDGVYGIDVDRNGLAWIRTGTAMMTFDGSRWRWMDTLHWSGMAATEENRIGLTWTSQVAFDSAGGTWFTVINRRGQGLAHLHDGIWSMHVIPGREGNKLPSLHFGQIAADRNGDIWLPLDRATDTVMFRFDGRSWTTYSLAGGLGPGADLVLTVDSHNQIWLGATGEDAVEEFDGTYWTHHDNLGKPGFGYGLWGLYLDQENHVWATAAAGVTRIDATPAFYPPSGTTFPGRDPYLLAFDRAGYTWVGSSAGLGRFKDGIWRAYGDTIADLISHGSFEVLKTGPDNSIWAGIHGVAIAVLDGEVATLSAPMAQAGRAAASLSLPYPNPASGEIAITLHMLKRTRARLALLDGLGQTVAIPLDAMLDPGDHEMMIPTGGVPAGAYFLQLSTPSGSEVRPVAIVR